MAARLRRVLAAGLAAVAIAALAGLAVGGAPTPLAKGARVFPPYPDVWGRQPDLPDFADWDLAMITAVPDGRVFLLYRGWARQAKSWHHVSVEFFSGKIYWGKTFFRQAASWGGSGTGYLGPSSVPDRVNPGSWHWHLTLSHRDGGLAPAQGYAFEREKAKFLSVQAATIRAETRLHFEPDVVWHGTCYFGLAPALLRTWDRAGVMFRPGDYLEVQIFFHRGADGRAVSLDMLDASTSPPAAVPSECPVNGEPLIFRERIRALAMGDTVALRDGRSFIAADGGSTDGPVLRLRYEDLDSPYIRPENRLYRVVSTHSIQREYWYLDEDQGFLTRAEAEARLARAVGIPLDDGDD